MRLMTRKDKARYSAIMRQLSELSRNGWSGATHADYAPLEAELKALVEKTITSRKGSDFLAVILIGTGSSWGRSRIKEQAIKHAISNLRDWESLFEVANLDVVVNVYDVSGYSEVHWGGAAPQLRGRNRATGVDEVIDRVPEHVRRTTPDWRKRRD